MPHPSLTNAEIRRLKSAAQRLEPVEQNVEQALTGQRAQSNVVA